MLNLAREAKKLTGADYLCMAGGVALNCVANGKLDDAKIFKQVFVQPAAGDAGGALGAAYAANFIYFGNERKVDPTKMDASKVLISVQKHPTRMCSLPPANTMQLSERFGSEDAMVEKVAGLIAAGNVIGWHQGRMEFGPRALEPAASSPMRATPRCKRSLT